MRFNLPRLVLVSVLASVSCSDSDDGASPGAGGSGGRDRRLERRRFGRRRRGDRWHGGDGDAVARTARLPAARAARRWRGRLPPAGRAPGRGD